MPQFRQPETMKTASATRAATARERSLSREPVALSCSDRSLAVAALTKNRFLAAARDDSGEGYTIGENALESPRVGAKGRSGIIKMNEKYSEPGDLPSRPGRPLLPVAWSHGSPAELDSASRSWTSEVSD